MPITLIWNSSVIVNKVQFDVRGWWTPSNSASWITSKRAFSYSRLKWFYHFQWETFHKLGKVIIPYILDIYLYDKKGITNIFTLQQTTGVWLWMMNIEDIFWKNERSRKCITYLRTIVTLIRSFYFWSTIKRQQDVWRWRSITTCLRIMTSRVFIHYSIGYFR